MLERPFAHCYETGGMRRLDLRGRKNILKRLLVHVAGFNLSLVLRLMIGKGTPRGLQDFATAYFLVVVALINAIRECLLGLARCSPVSWQPFAALPTFKPEITILVSTTGC